MKKKYKKPEIKWLAMDTSYGVMQDASPSFVPDKEDTSKPNVDIHAKEQHFHSYSVWE